MQRYYAIGLWSEETYAFESARSNCNGMTEVYVKHEADAKIADLQKRLNIALSYVTSNQHSWCPYDGRTFSSEEILEMNGIHRKTTSSSL